MPRKRKPENDDHAPSPKRKGMPRKRKPENDDLGGTSRSKEVIEPTHNLRKTRASEKVVKPQQDDGSDDGSDSDDVFEVGKRNPDESSTSWKQQDKDLRKKGSANRLITINSTFVGKQKRAIELVGFGGLLTIKCSSVPEKLTHWLVNSFDIDKEEIVIPMKGTIKVDDQSVNRLFGLPMGGEDIKYEMKSGSETYKEFYRVFDPQQEHKAPSFTQAEKWLLQVGKGRDDETWLRYWLVFTISSFLCPTSGTTLSVRSFHAVARTSAIKSYNWCKLVREKLIDGIRQFKEDGSRKSVSGCMLFLTLVCLDSLDTGNLVDQTERVRASVWTDNLVKDVVAMDRMANNKFGKLPLKVEHRRNIPSMLLNPEMIEDFVNENMTNDSIALNREVFKRIIADFTSANQQIIADFSSTINQNVRDLVFQLCHGSQQAVHSNTVVDQRSMPTARGANRPSSTKVAASSKKAKDQLESIVEYSSSSSEEDCEEDCGDQSFDKDHVDTTHHVNTTCHNEDQAPKTNSSHTLRNVSETSQIRPMCDMVQDADKGVVDEQANTDVTSPPHPDAPSVDVEESPMKNKHANNTIDSGSKDESVENKEDGADNKGSLPGQEDDGQKTLPHPDTPIVDVVESISGDGQKTPPQGNEDGDQDDEDGGTLGGTLNIMDLVNLKVVDTPPMERVLRKMPVIESPEFFEVSTKLKLGNVFANIDTIPQDTSADVFEEQMRKDCEKFEENFVKDMVDNHVSPKTKKRVAKSPPKKVYTKRKRLVTKDDRNNQKGVGLPPLQPQKTITVNPKVAARQEQTTGMQMQEQTLDSKKTDEDSDDKEDTTKTVADPGGNMASASKADSDKEPEDANKKDGAPQPHR